MTKDILANTQYWFEHMDEFSTDDWLDKKVQIETREAGLFLLSEVARYKKDLETALNALRSYQYGNSSPDLAEEVVRKLTGV